MNTTKTLRTGTCGLILLLALTAVGCGKIGNPSPAKSPDVFDFAASSAASSGNCLVIQGTISGAAANLEYMGLELAPLSGPDDCPGCPFNPRESTEFNDTDIQLDANGRFTFSYCPDLAAPMYRWRLVGKNVHRGMPYVLTNPRVVVMPAK